MGSRKEKGGSEERTRGSWDVALRVSSSKSWVSHKFLSPALSWPSLICIWSAAHNHSLSSFSAPPGRHFRSFWQRVQFCKHLNQQLPQLGTVGDFTSRLGGLNSRKPGMPSTICGVSYEEPKRQEGKLLTNRLVKPSSEPCLDGAMKDTKIK